MRSSIASVTTTYNAAGFISRQMDALLSQTRPLQEIVVVDNASTDETATLIAERYPQVTVLRLEQNGGAAGAWAVGLEYAALKKGHDWIWTFDDDSVPAVDALERLMDGGARAGASDDMGLIAGLPVHRETGICYPPLLWRDGFIRPSPELLKQEVWFADLAFASGSMVSREMVGNIGLPRADFFMDFFDFEYCLRARSRGYKIAIITDVQFSHDVGHPRPVRFAGRSRLWPDHAPWREYYMSRNLVYSVWWLYPNARTKQFAVRHLARHAAGVVLFGSKKAISLVRMAQGFADGVRGRLGMRFAPAAEQLA